MFLFLHQDPSPGNKAASSLAFWLWIAKGHISIPLTGPHSAGSYFLSSASWPAFGHLSIWNVLFKLDFALTLLLCLRKISTEGSATFTLSLFSCLPLAFLCPKYLAWVFDFWAARSFPSASSHFLELMGTSKQNLCQRLSFYSTKHALTRPEAPNRNSGGLKAARNERLLHAGKYNIYTYMYITCMCVYMLSQNSLVMSVRDGGTKHVEVSKTRQIPVPCTWYLTEEAKLLKYLEI